jgi:hypothetical protein
MQAQYSPVVDGVQISDENWISQFIGIFIWFVYWLAVMISYLAYCGGFLRYSTFLFFIAAGLIVYAIIAKHTLCYRIGFYCYCAYTLIIIGYDVLTLFFLWFVVDMYEKFVGFALEIPKQAGENSSEIDKAKDIVGWALYFFKLMITLAFAIVIITELCFLCALKGKLKFFYAYDAYRLSKLQGASPVSPV